MKSSEKRLLTISLILLCFWATEGKLHSFDSQTTTTVAIALLFLPVIGVMDWKQASTLIPWGTIVLTGYDDVSMAVEAGKRGAYNFVTKPFENTKLLTDVRCAFERKEQTAENSSLRRASPW